MTFFPLLQQRRGFIFTCRARDSDHGNKSFLALLQESSYFYFSQLEAGQKRKGWQREREREREATCECVCDGEEEMQREVLNVETMLMVNGSPC